MKRSPTSAGILGAVGKPSIATCMEKSPMTTGTKHKLKGLEPSGEGRDTMWRALCADCDFVGKPAATPDNAMDSWTAHEKESGGIL